MKADPVGRAMAGAEMAPLSREQKMRICLVARAAFRRAKRLASHASPGATQGTAPATHGAPGGDGAERRAPRDGSALREEPWRRVEQFKACGVAHLTCATQKDFLPLMAHFRMLMGQGILANRLAARGMMQGREVALHKLRAACERAADVMPEAWKYAEGFLRNKRHIEIAEAPTREIWHAVFLVRRRARQLRGQPDLRETYAGEIVPETDGAERRAPGEATESDGAERRAPGGATGTAQGSQESPETDGAERRAPGEAT